ncbi:MAG: hypothetical protein KJ645_02090 [Planctomycetes bacterium]|nr:hypothetical protein [Planctomycetota bacterium]
MLDRKAVFSCLLIAVLIVSFPRSAVSQEPKPDERTFWENFQRHHKEEGAEEVLKFVRRNKDAGSDAFEFYFIYYALNGPDSLDAEALKALAGHLGVALKNSYQLYKFETYLGLEPGAKESWGRAWNHYVNGFLAYKEAKELDNPYKMDEAQNAFNTAHEMFAFLGDKVAEADLLLHLGETADAFKDGYTASVSYKKALDLYDSLPAKYNELPLSFPNHELIRQRLQEYLDKGYDPAKPRNEGGEPDLTTATAEVESAAAEDDGGFRRATFTLIGDDNAQSWPLKFGAMKSPDDYITPAFESGFNPLLWSKFWFNSEEAGGEQQFVPFFAMEYYYYGFFNRPLKLTNDDGTFYLDIDGEKRSRVELRATTKPTKLLIKDVEKDEEGRVLQYQFFFQSPGDKEVMFGMTQNNAAGADPAILSLRARTGCYMKGKVLDENVIFLDDNCTGAFGDNNRKDKDGITDGDFPYWRLDAVVVGREKIARPLSQCMQFNDKWYWVSWNPTGDTFTTAEVKVDTGTVRMDWQGDLQPTYLILHMIDPDCPNCFINVAGGDPVELPIGDYEIACGKIESFKKGQSKQVRIYQGKANPIQVYKGKETVLELGAPYTFTLETESLLGEFTVIGKSIKVWGRGGELYTVFFDQVPGPLISIRDQASGKVLLRNEKMRIAALENFYEDSMCIWYPLDFSFENKLGGTLQAKLEAKTIEMLGGPVTSVWQ